MWWKILLVSSLIDLSCLCLDSDINTTALQWGTQSQQIDYRRSIIKGVEAEPHKWKSMARISKKATMATNCGGVLIHPQYVLTAAHCKGDVVVLGEHNVDMPDQNRQIIGIDQWIRHPDWNNPMKPPKQGDLALIKLVKSAQINTYVETANLLEEDLDVGQAECFIAGWGRTSPLGPTSKVLMEAVVPTLVQSECQLQWIQVNMWIDETKFCVGHYGSSTSCVGDSGGPLYYMKGQEVFVAGVTSFGPFGCIRSKLFHLPTVYTNTKAYMDWIIWTIVRTIY